MWAFLAAVGARIYATATWIYAVATWIYEWFYPPPRFTAGDRVDVWVEDQGWQVMMVVKMYPMSNGHYYDLTWPSETQPRTLKLVPEKRLAPYNTQTNLEAVLEQYRQGTYQKSPLIYILIDPEEVNVEYRTLYYLGVGGFGISRRFIDEGRMALHFHRGSVHLPRLTEEGNTYLQQFDPISDLQNLTVPSVMDVFDLTIQCADVLEPQVSLFERRSKCVVQEVTEQAITFFQVYDYQHNGTRVFEMPIGANVLTPAGKIHLTRRVYHQVGDRVDVEYNRNEWTIGLVTRVWYYDEPYYEVQVVPDASRRTIKVHQRQVDYYGTHTSLSAEVEAWKAGLWEPFPTILSFQQTVSGNYWEEIKVFAIVDGFFVNGMKAPRATASYEAGPWKSTSFVQLDLTKDGQWTTREVMAPGEDEVTPQVEPQKGRTVMVKTGDGVERSYLVEAVTKNQLTLILYDTDYPELQRPFTLPRQSTLYRCDADQPGQALVTAFGDGLSD